MTGDETAQELSWFVAHDGVQSGPFERREVERLVLAGDLADNDLVWCEGWPQWKPVGESFAEAQPAALQPEWRTASKGSDAHSSASLRVRPVAVRSPLLKYAAMTALAIVLAGAGAWSLTGGSRKVYRTATGAPELVPDQPATEVTPKPAPPAASGTASPRLIELRGHSGPVMAAKFSWTGARLVTASRDGTARVWDSETGLPVLSLKGHAGDVTSAEFGVYDTRILTRSSDGTARIWDASTGRPLLLLTGHTEAINSAAFCASEAFVVTASNDDTARIWDATTGATVMTLSGHSHEVSSARFDGDCTRVLTHSEDKTAILWLAASGQAAIRYEVFPSGIRHAELSLADGSRALVVSGDQVSIKSTRTDEPTGEAVSTIRGSGGEIVGAAFDPAGTRVVLSSAGSPDARIVTVQDGQIAAALSGHGGVVRTAHFSPDSKRVVTGSDDGTARLWDAGTGKPGPVLAGHTGAVRTAALSPDGLRIATTCDDHVARLWVLEPTHLVAAGVPQQPTPAK